MNPLSNTEYWNKEFALKEDYEFIENNIDGIENVDPTKPSISFKIFEHSDSECKNYYKSINFFGWYFNKK